MKADTFNHQNSVQYYISIILRFLIGCVFLLSAVGKLIDPYPTIQFLMALFNVYIFTYISAVVYFFIGFEFLLAFFLFLGWHKKFFLWTSLLLLIAFCLVISWQLVTNSGTTDCGCFGAFASPTSLSIDLLRDLGLILVVGIILFLEKKYISKPITNG